MKERPVISNYLTYVKTVSCLSFIDYLYFNIMYHLAITWCVLPSPLMHAFSRLPLFHSAYTTSPSLCPILQFFNINMWNGYLSCEKL